MIPGIDDDTIDYERLRIVEAPLVDTRTCTVCGVSKPLWDYGQHRRVYKGKVHKVRMAKCKACRALRERERRAENAPAKPQKRDDT